MHGITPVAARFAFLSLAAVLLCSAARGGTTPPFEQFVSADKHLDTARVKSLTERGAPHVCTGPELKYIGMPVGGLFSGQLYIGGDGQLGNRDIFNDLVFTGWSGTCGPVKPTKPLEQAFSLTVDGTDVALDTTGFSDLAFRGEYPLAFVTYRDAKQPVEARLTAFSPFIPPNAVYAGYFNEVMTGFEHQLAGLTLREGMTAGGLANSPNPSRLRRGKTSELP